MSDRLNNLFEISAEEPEAAVYHASITELIRIFQEHPVAVIAYPLFLADEFIHLLRQRKHMALIIFIYYGVTLNLIKEWWTEGVGKRLVNTLSIPGDVLQTKPQWAAALKWARQQVGLNPELALSDFKPIVRVSQRLNASKFHC